MADFSSGTEFIRNFRFNQPDLSSLDPLTPSQQERLEDLLTTSNNDLRFSKEITGDNALSDFYALGFRSIFEIPLVGRRLLQFFDANPSAILGVTNDGGANIHVTVPDDNGTEPPRVCRRLLMYINRSHYEQYEEQIFS